MYFVVIVTPIDHTAAVHRLNRNGLKSKILFSVIICLETFKTPLQSSKKHSPFRRDKAKAREILSSPNAVEYVVRGK